MLFIVTVVRGELVISDLGIMLDRSKFGFELVWICCLGIGPVGCHFCLAIVLGSHPISSLWKLLHVIHFVTLRDSFFVQLAASCPAGRRQTGHRLFLTAILHRSSGVILLFNSRWHSGAEWFDSKPKELQKGHICLDF